MAGNQLRNILKRMTTNKFMGILTGFIVTCALQSSSASTVMVISFVNAGLLTLAESMGVVMGANIGTTITGWIISFFGFKVNITFVAIILVGVTFPFLFSGNSKYRNFAEFIIGFGILFIGLDFMKKAVPDVKNNPEILEFVTSFSDAGFASILLFVLVGTILTVVIQSSSATMTLTLVMMAKGWVTLPIAAAMIMGENIGTTITANIAAVVGNVHAKRAARFHLLFNLIGIAWLLVLFYPFLDFIDWLAQTALGNTMSSFEITVAETEAPKTLALFHTVFNISNVLLLYWLIPVLTKVVIRIQPSKGDPDEVFRLQYISSGLLSTPELSIEEAVKEIQQFVRLIDKMCVSFMVLCLEPSKNHNKLIKKIKKREDITDRLELEIARYLTRISEGEISSKTSSRIRSMLRMVNDLERIGDIFYQATLAVDGLKKDNKHFPTEAEEDLRQMLDLVYKAIKLMRKNLQQIPEGVDLTEAYDLEDDINSLRDKIQGSHMARLSSEVYSFQIGMIFMDIIASMEKLADHIININEAYAGKK